jgi:hypothetical protein
MSYPICRSFKGRKEMIETKKKRCEEEIWKKEEKTEIKRKETTRV